MFELTFQADTTCYRYLARSTAKCCNFNRTYIEVVALGRGACYLKLQTITHSLVVMISFTSYKIFITVTNSQLQKNWSSNFYSETQ